MSFGEAAATINARVSENGAFGNPSERKQGQQETEPKFRALQRRRPLEVVEVDALREFLSCACACHCLLENRKSKLENRKPAASRYPPKRRNLEFSSAAP